MKVKTMNASDVLGVPSKRIDEIGKFMETHLPEHESWITLIELTKKELHIKTKEEYMCIGWVWGRIYEQQEQHLKIHSMMEEVDELMEQLKVQTAKSDIKN